MSRQVVDHALSCLYERARVRFVRSQQLGALFGCTAVFLYEMEMGGLLGVGRAGAPPTLRFFFLFLRIFLVVGDLPFVHIL